MVFSLLILVNFIYLKLINFRYFLTISMLIFISIFLNTKSFLSLGLADEHLELRNKFFSVFYKMDQNIEILTKNINLENSEFLTYDWIDDEINKNLINPKIFYDEFSYDILLVEIKNLNIKLVMEKIIEMATLYKFGKKLSSKEELNFINVLDTTIGKYIRFNDDKKIYMIKALLDIRDLNNKKILVKNYENYKKNEINKNADISSNEVKDTVDNNQSQYMKIKNDQNVSLVKFQILH